MKTPVSLLLAMLLAGGLACAADRSTEEKKGNGPAPAAEGKAVFELGEASTFGQADGMGRLTRGQMAVCATQPAKEVRKYPEMKSKRPLYGSVRFGASVTDAKAGTEYYFALDESGEGSTKAGERHYDRFYLDVNRDLDLTNDAVAPVMKNPPAAALRGSDAKQTAYFEYVTVGIDWDNSSGSVRVLPRFIDVSEDYAVVTFVAATIRKGEIRIGEQRYNVILGQPYIITGRFDTPYTYIELSRIGSVEENDYRWGMDQLGALRQVGREAYVLSATAAGDKLTVERYSGDYGLFVIGAGGRDIKKMHVQGSINTAKMPVALGPMSHEAKDQLREHRVPVGDYLPNYITVQYGRFQIGISHNYHSDGKPRDRGGKALVYGMQVRKDNPFVLDFSNKPEVMFASPAKDQVFRPGDEIRMAAVLTDPVLDFMIRRLNDTTRKEKETVKFGNGQETVIDRDVSLDPIVTITDASGKAVYTGKMPFG